MSTETRLHEELGVIEFCLKYPFSNEDSKHGASVQGIAAFLLAPFFIPLLMLIGYSMNIRQAAYEGERVPKFESYESLITEGKNGVISYLPPIIFAISAFFASGYISPVFLGFIGFALYIWPAIGIMYAKNRDYQNVYNGEIVALLTSDMYIRAFTKYMALLAGLIVLTIFAGSVTLGLGSILLLPILLFSRPAYWGYTYRSIEDNIGSA